MYGGRIGIRLGKAVPCFSCPYVGGCAGECFLMGLQGNIGFGRAAGTLSGQVLLNSIGWFALFAVLVAFLGKLWCGWICPFGLISDWLTTLRKKLKIREREMTIEIKRKLSPIKYILLIYAIVIPPFVTAGLIHPDFFLPFCNICPGKSILPVFAGNFSYLALNFANPVTLTFSILLLLFTGISLVGMFFKERFFCIFCPMLAFIHLLKPITLLRLGKTNTACTGCGNCKRECPMDIEEVYLERKKKDVQTAECLDCGKCIEVCPSSGALQLRFAKWKLFVSDKLYTRKSA